MTNTERKTFVNSDQLVSHGYLDPVLQALHYDENTPIFTEDIPHGVITMDELDFLYTILGEEKTYMYNHEINEVRSDAQEVPLPTIKQRHKLLGEVDHQKLATKTEEFLDKQGFPTIKKLINDMRVDDPWDRNQVAHYFVDMYHLFTNDRERFESEVGEYSQTILCGYQLMGLLSDHPRLWNQTDRRVPFDQVRSRQKKFLALTMINKLYPPEVV